MAVLDRFTKFSHVKSTFFSVLKVCGSGSARAAFLLAKRLGCKTTETDSPGSYWPGTYALAARFSYRPCGGRVIICG